MLVVSLSKLALFPLRLSPSLGLSLCSLPFLSVPSTNRYLRLRKSSSNDRLRVISGYVALLATLPATLPAFFLFFLVFLLEGPLSHWDPGLSQDIRHIFLAMLEGACAVPELPASLPEFAFPSTLKLRFLLAFKLKLMGLRFTLLRFDNLEYLLYLSLFL
jgi:hypothetical protein